MKHNRHSSPCVVRATLTCVYLKDGTKVVMMRGEISNSAWLEVVPQSVIKAQEPLGKHSWILKFDHWVCSKCGIVRRADDKNKPCPGVVKITTRVKQLPKGWEKEAMREANKEKEFNTAKSKKSKRVVLGNCPPQTRYGGFFIGNCKKCGRYGPLCNGNGICHGCGGFDEGRSRIRILTKTKPKPNYPVLTAKGREAWLKLVQKQKPKKYPEVDRFIGKKRKMEKKQAKHPEQILTLKTGRSFWDRTDPTVRIPLGDGNAYNEIERKANRRRKP